MQYRKQYTVPLPPLGQLAFRETHSYRGTMVSAELTQESAGRLGLIFSELWYVEVEYSGSVSVRVLQAHTRACVLLAEGRALLQR